MDDNELTLKPCACGVDPVFIRVKEIGNPDFYAVRVGCPNCGAVTARYAKKAMAAWAWNKGATQ